MDGKFPFYLSSTKAVEGAGEEWEFESSAFKRSSRTTFINSPALLPALRCAGRCPYCGGLQYSTVGLELIHSLGGIFIPCLGW